MAPPRKNSRKGKQPAARVPKRKAIQPGSDSEEEGFNNRQAKQARQISFDAEMAQKLQDSINEMASRMDAMKQSAKPAKHHTVESARSAEISKPGNKRQYEVNSQVIENLKIVEGEIEAPKLDAAYVGKVIQDTVALLEERQRQIQFADGSLAGWEGVNEHERIRSMATDKKEMQELALAEQRVLQRRQGPGGDKSGGRGPTFFRGSFGRGRGGYGSQRGHAASQRLSRAVEGGNVCFGCSSPNHWVKHCPFAALQGNRGPGFQKPGGNDDTDPEFKK